MADKKQEEEVLNNFVKSMGDLSKVLNNQFNALQKEIKKADPESFTGFEEAVQEFKKGDKFKELDNELKALNKKIEKL